MKRWYSHRFHHVSLLRLVFFTMRWTPNWVQAPMAMVTALIFFLILKRGAARCRAESAAGYGAPGLGAALAGLSRLLLLLRPDGFLLLCSPGQ